MLRDSLNRAIELYKVGAAPKLLMSGDHGRKNYDELAIMKQYAIDAGVPSSDIFMDHAGFSTYESVYRAKEIFKASKIIIITQKYICIVHCMLQINLEWRLLGLPQIISVTGDKLYEMRARCKDFATTIFKPEPTYLGEVIPVTGNGDITND